MASRNAIKAGFMTIALNQAKAYGPLSRKMRSLEEQCAAVVNDSPEVQAALLEASMPSPVMAVAIRARDLLARSLTAGGVSIAETVDVLRELERVTGVAHG